MDEADKAKKLIGYLPEQPPLYMSETPIEYLQFVDETKGLRGIELLQIQETIVQTKIETVKNRRISTLSKDYKPGGTNYRNCYERRKWSFYGRYPNKQ